MLAASLHGGHLHLSAKHVCGRHCLDHYWNGTKYVVLRGHRHGPGCGHVFSKNRWLVSKAAHKARVVAPKSHHDSTKKSKTQAGPVQKRKGKSKKLRGPHDRP